MERKSMADRHAARAAEQQQAAEWLANNADALSDAVSVTAVELYNEVRTYFMETS